jgi:hypothetical protein
VALRAEQMIISEKSWFFLNLNILFIFFYLISTGIKGVRVAIPLHTISSGCSKSKLVSIGKDKSLKSHTTDCVTDLDFKKAG